MFRVLPWCRVDALPVDSLLILFGNVSCAWTEGQFEGVAGVPIITVDIVITVLNPNTVYFPGRSCWLQCSADCFACIACADVPWHGQLSYHVVCTGLCEFCSQIKHLDVAAMLLLLLCHASRRTAASSLSTYINRGLGAVSHTTDVD